MIEEFLLSHCNPTICNVEWSDFKLMLEQAKEIEKQKSINDFVAGNKLEFYDGTEKECAEQYYEQTYGGNNHLCCTPEGQIKRYVNCIGCDRKPLIQGGNK